MTNNVDLTAMALALAGAKKSCPCWDWYWNDKGTKSPTCENCKEPSRVFRDEDKRESACALLCDCQGTGEVYVLGPEVRVECLYHTIYDAQGCEACGDRGWLPLGPEKLGRWMVTWHEAKGTILIQWDSLAEQYNAVVDWKVLGKTGCADTPEEAFFTAAMKALGLGTQLIDGEPFVLETTMITKTQVILE